MDRHTHSPNSIILPRIKFSVLQEIKLCNFSCSAIRMEPLLYLLKLTCGINSLRRNFVTSSKNMTETSHHRLTVTCSTKCSNQTEVREQTVLVWLLVSVEWSVFTSVTIICFFSYSQHGSYYSGVYCCSLGYSCEFLLLFLHWFPLNFFIMKGDIIILWL
jgi:hypothetical protein